MFFLISGWGLWVRERNVATSSNQAADHIKDLSTANGSFVFPIFILSCVQHFLQLCIWVAFPQQ